MTVHGYYVNNFKKMLTDSNFTSSELSAIASGYTRILEEANGVLGDLKQVVNITTLSMTDKDRMDVGRVNDRPLGICPACAEEQAKQNER